MEVENTTCMGIRIMVMPELCVVHSMSIYGKRRGLCIMRYIRNSMHHDVIAFPYAEIGVDVHLHVCSCSKKKTHVSALMLCPNMEIRSRLGALHLE